MFHCIHPVASSSLQLIHSSWFECTKSTASRRIILFGFDIWTAQRLYVLIAKIVFNAFSSGLEFVNYLHMIFYSQLAITYCCVFLIIQAQFYYSRIATKMRKHWQQREIINHINNRYSLILCNFTKKYCVFSYLPASEEDLLKNEQCLICWQTMKSARKLPCSHMLVI